MFPNVNTKCVMRGCNYKYDCLNHIMQTCNYNYNNRIHRHNYVNNLLILLLNKHHYITILEPYLETRNGLCKPDIITYKNDTAYILDTKISIYISYVTYQILITYKRLTTITRQI